VLQAGGILFIYTVRQYSVQKEMEEVLNSAETQFETITLSISEYQKSRVNAHEISLDGEMYDIKSLTVKGNVVELRAVHDSKERNILKGIKDYSNQTNHPDKNLPNQLQQLLSLNYIANAGGKLCIIPSSSINIFAFSDPAIVSNNADISTPPPKLV
jgi:hypothetical protein